SGQGERWPPTCRTKRQQHQAGWACESNNPSRQTSIQYSAGGRLQGLVSAFGSKRFLSGPGRQWPETESQLKFQQAVHDVTRNVRQARRPTLNMSRIEHSAKPAATPAIR